MHQNTENPSVHLEDLYALPPSLPNSLLSVASKVSVKYPSVPVYGYHKAVHGYPGPLRNRCRCYGHYSRWHVLPQYVAVVRHEPLRRG